MSLNAREVQCFHFQTPALAFVVGTGYTLEALNVSQNIIPARENSFIANLIYDLKITASQRTNLELYKMYFIENVLHKKNT